MGSVNVKSLKVLKHMLMVPWHPILIALFLDVYVMLDKLLITSAFRNGDPRCHGTVPLRAFDLRSRSYKDPQAIADRVNERWIYDPDRPDMKCCVYHNVGKGIHLHFQVHPNTIYKGV